MSGWPHCSLSACWLQAGSPYLQLENISFARSRLWPEFLLILLSSRLRNLSPRKYKQISLLHLNASALPVGWEADLNLYKFNLVKIGQENLPWENEMNIYVLILTELQGSVWSLVAERSIPMPLGLLPHPVTQMFISLLVDWPDQLHWGTASICSSLSLSYPPISVNCAGVTVSVNSPILFPQCGLDKCCPFLSSYLIKLIPAFFFQGLVTNSETCLFCACENNSRLFNSHP